MSETARKIVPIRGVNRLCPEDGSRLVVRTNRDTGQRFLACPKYPECKYTEPLPEDINMRELGAQELPF